MYVTGRIFEKTENRTAKWTFCVQHLQSSHRHFSFPPFLTLSFSRFLIFPSLVCLQGGENTLKRVQGIKPLLIRRSDSSHFCRVRSVLEDSR